MQKKKMNSQVINKNMNNVNTNRIQPQHNAGLTLMKSTAPENAQVVAVIVSFCQSASYDNLFTTVEQKTLQGTKVLVYSCQSNYLPSLIKAFTGQPQDDTATGLINNIKQVQPDCVVFNWQCSSGYHSKTFPEGSNHLFTFLKIILDRGHMAMFSDFSLKALISEWKGEQIGPNPFIQTAEHSGQFQIRFRSEDLATCPSAQLQIVGEIADKGFCNVIAAGGTIVYSVDQKKLNHQAYTLQILTVVPAFTPNDESLICKVGELKGSAGHVLLKYKSGGMILTSMGHWVALMQLDTSEKKLFQIAEQEYGVQYANQMKKEYQGMNQGERQEYRSKNAREFVKNQAPCSNMNRKKKG